MTTSVPEYGGCLWPMDPACATAEWDAMDDAVKDRALALASSTLHRLTGGRVGNCPITVRPCTRSRFMVRDHMIPSYLGGPFHPGIDRMGQWVNFIGCGSECEPCEVTLPGPVGRVDEVKVDGGIIPRTSYRVDGERLVWTGDGDCPWPSDQDLSKPDTQTGTFSITYLNAYPPDSLAAYAVGVLAMEFARACSGNKCRLPSGVTSIVRQGITMEVAGGTFPNGVTGIREVDAWVTLWTPGGLVRQASVWTPDRRTTRSMR